MKSLIAVMAIVLLTAVSCKKKKSSDTPASYMPNTANSTWNYSIKSYAPVSTTGSYTLKATNKDTTINSRTYRVYTNSGGQNDYYTQVGTDYYQLGNVGALGGQRVELLFLKDAAVGTTWSETQTVNFPGFPTPLSVPVNYQITEKGISYPVGSTTFTDVTHVKVTLGAVSVSGFPITPTSDLNFYYARGIGRIYSRTKIAVSVPLVGLNINMDDELTLTSYTIQ